MENDSSKGTSARQRTQVDGLLFIVKSIQEECEIELLALEMQGGEGLSSHRRWNYIKSLCLLAQKDFGRAP